MASSSASVSTRCYDVFLSFRGDDTRHSFTSHLYSSLVQNDIKVFIDDDGLERGHEISQALKDAIDRSKLSIVVFSKDYASSSWCLDELVHILECRRRKDRIQIVLPVFYHIVPSDVRKQKGIYEASFANHEERFRGEIGKVKIWREALEEAANLSGWDSQVVRSESELVGKIVEDVLKKLNSVHLDDDFTGFVGLERRSKKIEDLLRVASPELLRTIGIWGTGGIGKTTLARIIFQRLYSEFDACCFVKDVRVDWEQGRKKYYDSKDTLFDHQRLRGKRVLVVLDNVNDPEQLEILAEDANRFGPGSRIIVTTRDMQILRGEVDDTYRVEKLDSEEALRLFRSTALRKKAHREDDPTRELYESIINYADGIPLALKVLSSFFRGKRRANWEAELIKLKECPHKKLMNILRTSYDGLDEMQKCIFLDVACFFKNEFRADTERILEACGLHPKAGLDDLVDKSLISVIDGKLCMHDLIQQMAQSAVNSKVELENRSRLWVSKDAVHILETKIGTKKIEGIFLDMSKICKIEFDSGAFQNTSKLRFLKIFHSDLRKTCELSIKREDMPGLHLVPGSRRYRMPKLKFLKIFHSKTCEVSIKCEDMADLHFFPSSLRYLYWEVFPWKSFPQSFRPEYLVELNIPFSNIVQLWEGIQPLGNLIKIDVSHSKSLIELPDLSQASKLEHVYLEYCTSLREVPSSLENLDKLKTLNLNGCSSIHKFPKLPKSIVCLVLSGTAIEVVPQSIQYLNHLEILNLCGCENVVCLPSFSTMQNIKAFSLPEMTDSRKISWIDKVYKSGGYLPLEGETSRGFQTEVPHYMIYPIRKLSKADALLVLPFFNYNFIDIFDSVAIVTLCGDFCGDILFFNCLGFYGGGRDVEIVNACLNLISTDVVYQEFTTVDSLEADVGFCCKAGNIPDWFEYQCTGDTVSIGFRTTTDREILGFALCAVVDFSVNSDGRKEHNLLRIIGGSDNFNFLCEPTYTYATNYNDNDSMKDCFPRQSTFV